MLPSEWVQSVILHFRCLKEVEIKFEAYWGRFSHYTFPSGGSSVYGGNYILAPQTDWVFSFCWVPKWYFTNCTHTHLCCSRITLSKRLNPHHGPWSLILSSALFSPSTLFNTRKLGGVMYSPNFHLKHSRWNIFSLKIFWKQNIKTFQFGDIY